MVIELDMKDLLLVILISFTTAYFFRWLQNKPNKQLGIFDFIIGKHDEKTRFNAVILIFVNPFFIGLVAGIFNLLPSIFIGIGTALGALLTVSTSFISPNMLAPTLQKYLFKARVVYLFLVITYGLLGAGGSLLIEMLSTLTVDNTLHSNLITSALVQLIIITVPFMFKFYLTNRYQFIYKDENLITKNQHMKKMISVELTKAVDEISASLSENKLNASIQIEEMKQMINEQLERQMAQVTDMIELAFKQDVIRGLKGEEYGYYSNLDTVSYTRSYLTDNNFLEDYISYESGYDYDHADQYIKSSYPGYFS